MARRGVPATLESIREEIRERDVRDRTRPIAPLKQADDAIYLDTSEMSAEEAAAHIADLARSRS